MKCIIAGGRDFVPTDKDYYLVRRLINQYKITEIVSGGAKGADAYGERVANKDKLKLTIFPADWNKYGKRAGYLRNLKMGKYTDVAILFPGGVGTSMMRDIMNRLGKEIIYDAK